eukprot:TRINITY_DN3031_c0_g1_i1.p2 TRINITY_DN3031_c0_g1~~TRINITY_DN3031_c0_g1_i1.p2  ORF type:complete len:343 (-),score=87.33 TRINITY_DN3031_c0_g1_i1:260-1288(-)
MNELLNGAQTPSESDQEVRPIEDLDPDILFAHQIARAGVDWDVEDEEGRDGEGERHIDFFTRVFGRTVGDLETENRHKNSSGVESVSESETEPNVFEAPREELVAYVKEFIIDYYSQGKTDSFDLASSRVYDGTVKLLNAKERKYVILVFNTFMFLRMNCFGIPDPFLQIVESHASPGLLSAIKLPPVITLLYAVMTNSISYWKSFVAICEQQWEACSGIEERFHEALIAMIQNDHFNQEFYVQTYHEDGEELEDDAFDDDAELRLLVPPHIPASATPSSESSNDETVSGNGATIPPPLPPRPPTGFFKRVYPLCDDDPEMKFPESALGDIDFDEFLKKFEF